MLSARFEGFFIDFQANIALCFHWMAWMASWMTSWTAGFFISAPAAGRPLTP